MGLFKRLFGNNKEMLHVEVGISHEYVKPEIPNASVLYKKTCPEMIRYKIRGRDNRSKRLCTVKKIVLASVDQSSVIATTNLYDIQSCEVIIPDPPTERQLSYATDLGIIISDNYSKDDISCLITRALYEEDRDDMIPVDQSLAKMAADRDIYLSVFSGEKRALDYLWFKFEEDDKLRFLIFCIHQNLQGEKDYDIGCSSYLDLYDRFVESHRDDQQLRRSLSRYVGSDLSLHKAPNRNRMAYTIVTEFLASAR